MSEPLRCEELRDLLRYDAETGALHWRARDGGPAWWNERHAGQPAMCTPDTGGYLCGSIMNRKYLTHRVVWALAHGEWPEEIDHINGDRADNRLSNLRAADRHLNGRNRRIPKHNTSGHIGVSYCNQTGRWRAQIKVDNQTIHIGRFDTADQAAEARQQAQARHGFHENHGRPA